MEKLKSKARARYAFAAFLGQQNMRCTPERLLVLDTALDFREPFTADVLHRACLTGSDALRVSRATVFNTLPLLVKAGYLMRLSAPGVEGCYETIRIAGSIKPRIFLVCSGCGKMLRRTSPALADWLDAQSFRDFTPNSQSAITYVYGECNKCRKSHNQNIISK